MGEMASSDNLYSRLYWTNI